MFSVEFPDSNSPCHSHPWQGLMLCLTPGWSEFRLYDLSQWVMLHLVDYSAHSRHSVIVPGLYNLATSFPPAVRRVDKLITTCGLTVLEQNSTGSPRSCLQTGLPQEHCLWVWWAPRSASSCHTGLCPPTGHLCWPHPHVLSSDKVQNINSISGLESSRVNLQGA